MEPKAHHAVSTNSQSIFWTQVETSLYTLGPAKTLVLLKVNRVRFIRMNRSFKSILPTATGFKHASGYLISILWSIIFWSHCGHLPCLFNADMTRMGHGLLNCTWETCRCCLAFLKLVSLALSWNGCRWNLPIPWYCLQKTRPIMMLDDVMQLIFQKALLEWPRHMLNVEKLTDLTVLNTYLAQ